MFSKQGKENGIFNYAPHILITKTKLVFTVRDQE